MSDFDEFARYEDVLGRCNMNLILKDQSHAFWNGKQSNDPPAYMDHVFASEYLDIRCNKNFARISVKGWLELATDAEKDQWIAELSDHTMLYGEVYD